MRQRFLIIWANYWLRHLLGVATSVVLSVLIVGSSVAAVVTTAPPHKSTAKQKPLVGLDQRKTPTKSTPKPTPPVQPVAAAPPKPTPPVQPVAAAPPKAAPIPIAPTQPSPGTGVKQLVAADPPAPQSPAAPPPDNSAASPATGGYRSTNWSGYVSTDGGYTSISSSWVVPHARGNGSTTTADSAWIGIGGVSSNDLIQTGTLNIVSANGQADSYAFYELLPDAALIIPSVQVTAGDSMTATITETSANTWLVSITDATNGQNFTTTVSYTSTHSSAEWIEEDPSYGDGSLVPFDNFGTTFFSRGSLVSNGTTSNIANSNSQPITLVDANGKALATPSILTNNGAGFSVSRN